MSKVKIVDAYDREYIITLLKAQKTNKEIASLLNVGFKHIPYILRQLNINSRDYRGCASFYDREYIISLLKEQKTNKEIAALLNVDAKNIAYLLRRLGINSRDYRKNAIKYDADYILTLLKQNKSNKEIAAVLNVSSNHLSQIFRLLNIKATEIRKIYNNSSNNKSTNKTTNRNKTVSDRTNRTRSINWYWNELEIVKYIKQYTALSATDNAHERSIIFQRHLYQSFYTMSEIILNRYFSAKNNKYYDYDEQNETIQYVLTYIVRQNTLNKFNPDKARAFSYFQTVIKNCLIDYFTSVYTRQNRNADENYCDITEVDEQYIETEYAYYYDRESNESKICRAIEKIKQITFKEHSDTNYNELNKINNAVLEFFESDHDMQLNRNNLIIYLTQKFYYDEDTKHLTNASVLQRYFKKAFKYMVHSRDITRVQNKFIRSINSI